MKHAIIIFLLIPLSLVGQSLKSHLKDGGKEAADPFSLTTERSWTRQDGKELQARMTNCLGGVVFLQYQDSYGKMADYKVGLSQLSEADQQYVESILSDIYGPLDRLTGRVYEKADQYRTGKTWIIVTYYDAEEKTNMQAIVYGVPGFSEIVDNQKIDIFARRTGTSQSYGQTRKRYQYERDAEATKPQEPGQALR